MVSGSGTSVGGLLEALYWRVLVGVAAAVVVVSVSLADGGYFPNEWRWAGFVLLCGSVIALLVHDRIEFTWFGAGAFVVLAGLVLWTRAAAGWSLVPQGLSIEAGFEPATSGS
jgi:hypothetical protein